MATTHQAALETKHASLDRRIADEAARPQPDSGVIAHLKRLKLKIKEELAAL